MQTSHEPADYRCPFCERLAGKADEISTPADIVRRTDDAAAFISPRWWPNNRGHVLVVPTAHHENLYSIPADAYRAVGDLVREVAIAIRETYDCDGVSTRQHNEPASDQDVWHLHVHVFPRYEGDELYRSRPRPGWATPAERQVYAKRLQAYFAR
ncbi:HIT family protein [Glycomyces buryatensis]|uniref:HIT family protein n=1 Tax=Glycomyces buryatensis TaxID=2570927 RepID=A0A4S8QAX0_9ACTN|nr:HIT family protein [Glycomyces buryatensis]THV41663.1 HIT family protein [Glycomyces buryatensis]